MHTSMLAIALAGVSAAPGETPPPAPAAQPATTVVYAPLTAGIRPLPMPMYGPVYMNPGMPVVYPVVTYGTPVTVSGPMTNGTPVYSASPLVYYPAVPTPVGATTTAATAGPAMTYPAMRYPAMSYPAAPMYYPASYPSFPSFGGGGGCSRCR